MTFNTADRSSAGFGGEKCNILQAGIEFDTHNYVLICVQSPENKSQCVSVARNRQTEHYMYNFECFYFFIAKNYNNSVFAQKII